MPEPVQTTLGTADALAFSNVSVTFGTLPIVQNITFSVRQSEFVALIGPSGCGKTTFLNMAAGLLTPDAGHVTYRGAPLKGANTHAGYLTQEDALLPWRDVISNVSLPLEIKGLPKSERLDRARDILHLVGLKGFEHHRPRQLSGGMRKRVSLARTLIYKPETLLLDEPFSALDAQTRVIIQEQLLSICSELNLTVLLVTHDMAEAVGMANRVVLFSRRPATVSDVIDVGHGVVRHLTHTDAAHQVHVERIWEHLRAQSTDVPP